MKKLIIATMLFLSGCTSINHNKLFDGMPAPTELDKANITICRGGFIEIGMDCAELRGMPRWVHPMILSYFGCAVNYYREDGSIDHTVIFASSDIALRHELEHARGFADNINSTVSHNQDVVRDVSALVSVMISEYGDACYQY